MYSLYGIFNKINGKVYIGITNNVKRRWQEHKKHSKNITKNSYAVHLAINKYGLQNFIYKIIEILPNLDVANTREMEWIAFLKEERCQLYNETDGGDGTKGHGHSWTEEQKQKASVRNSGSGNPMYGVQLFGEANGNFGKEMKPHVKEELLKHRRKLSDEQIKEIISLFKTGNYTQTQLSKQFSISLSQIHRIVHNQSWSDNPNRDIKTKKNITIDNVRNIRKLYASGIYTQKELAKQFNLSIGHIRKIINREKWKNIY